LPESSPGTTAAKASIAAPFGWRSLGAVSSRWPQSPQGLWQRRSAQGAAKAGDTPDHSSTVMA